MIKRTVRIAVSSVLLAMLAASAALADVQVRVYVGERRMPSNAYVRNGATYGPLRTTAEAVGATVEWDPVSRRAVIVADGRRVLIERHQGIMVNGSFMIPIRLLGEALGRPVAWDRSARAVRMGGGPGYRGPYQDQWPGPRPGQYQDPRPDQRPGQYNDPRPDQRPGQYNDPRPDQRPGQHQEQDHRPGQPSR